MQLNQLQISRLNCAINSITKGNGFNNFLHEFKMFTKNSRIIGITKLIFFFLSLGYFLNRKRYIREYYCL